MSTEWDLVKEFKRRRKERRQGQSHVQQFMKDDDIIRHKLLIILECPICKTLLENPTRVKICGHYFCNECITDYYHQEQQECPVCKVQIVTKRYFVQDTRFQGIIKHYSLVELEEEKTRQIEQRLLSCTLTKVPVEESVQKKKRILQPIKPSSFQKPKQSSTNVKEEGMASRGSEPEDDSLITSFERKFQLPCEDIDDWTIILGYSESSIK